MSAQTPSRPHTSSTGRLSGSSLLFGAFLGAAFYLVQAGVMEILLARDAACLASSGQLRIGMLTDDVCLPEWQRLAMTGAAAGIAGIFLRGIRWLGWMVSAGLYALLGAGASTLRPRLRGVVFLGGYVFMTAIAAVLAYIAQFVV